MNAKTSTAPSAGWSGIVSAKQRVYEQGWKQVKEYERQIDQVVYKLYGLTDEETKIVESFQEKEKK